MTGMDKIIEAPDGPLLHWLWRGNLRASPSGIWASCFEQVQPHDLLKFGIIPELVGRLPVITTLQDLKKEELIRILTEPQERAVPPV